MIDSKPKTDGIPLGEWSGSDATKSLKATISKFNETTNKQTKTLIRLTWAITILTILLAVLAVIQTKALLK